MASWIVENERDQSMSPRTKQDLLDQFNARKSFLGPCPNDSSVLPQSMQFCPSDGAGGSWVINLSAEKIDKCFQDALRGPLQVAAERIGQLSQLANNRIVQVIVAGGTSRHPAIQAELTRLCSAANLRDPVFTDGLEIRYE